MKNSSIIIACLLALTGLSLSDITLAASGNMDVRFDCPKIGDKTESLTNYGSFISGQGTEHVGDNEGTSPLFRGPVMAGSNIPNDLAMAGYAHAGTSYSASSGLVSCHYMSVMGFTAFDVGYLMQNGTGGIVTKSGAEKINIMLNVGLKS